MNGKWGHRARKAQHVQLVLGTMGGVTKWKMRGGGGREISFWWKIKGFSLWAERGWKDNSTVFKVKKTNPLTLPFGCVGGAGWESGPLK